MFAGAEMFFKDLEVFGMFASLVTLGSVRLGLWVEMFGNVLKGCLFAYRRLVILKCFGNV